MRLVAHSSQAKHRVEFKRKTVEAEEPPVKLNKMSSDYCPSSIHLCSTHSFDQVSCANRLRSPSTSGPGHGSATDDVRLRHSHLDRISRRSSVVQLSVRPQGSVPAEAPLGHRVGFALFEAARHRVGRRHSVRAGNYSASVNGQRGRCSNYRDPRKPRILVLLFQRKRWH